MNARPLVTLTANAIRKLEDHRDKLASQAAPIAAPTGTAGEQNWKLNGNGRSVGNRPSRKDIEIIDEKWSEREDLNLRPLVSQTSALTGLRHAPMLFP